MSSLKLLIKLTWYTFHFPLDPTITLWRSCDFMVYGPRYLLLPWQLSCGFHGYHWISSQISSEGGKIMKRFLKVCLSKRALACSWWGFRVFYWNHCYKWAMPVPRHWDVSWLVLYLLFQLQQLCILLPVWPPLPILHDLLNVLALHPEKAEIDVDGFCFCFIPCPFFSWQFFIMLLIIFLLELTVVILFFVYTDKVSQILHFSFPFSKFICPFSL